MTDQNGFVTADRRRLFLELARRPEGATPAEVFARASELGDTVTAEAYYNIARRLMHRGLLITKPSDGGMRYHLSAGGDNQWLEEDDLAAIVSPEYPLIAVTVWREIHRQLNGIEASVWEELRERLRGQAALDLFFEAIVSYSDDFHAQIATLVRSEDPPARDLAEVRREAESSLWLLQRLTKYGLGLSDEAVHVPLSLESAISEFRTHEPTSYVDRDALRAELRERIADEPFVVEAPPLASDRSLLIAAVDGSTRSGILAFLGEDGDVSMSHAPMIAINTAIGQTNQFLRTGRKNKPVFLRLPERPEDMQRHDNRYTVMAKLLYPDLSDAEYMHSVWNAMDVVEARAALRLFRRWYLTEENLEVPVADVVLRDGTVSPQDRDFSHYQEISSYGRIVRDMIETNWELARTCRDNGQSLAGVVKAAQLSVFAPVLNWFACRVARNGDTQLVTWPLHMMNLMPDQVILTRLLTARRQRGQTWMRTCVVLRPFHALTNFARTYSSRISPAQHVLNEYMQAQGDPLHLTQEKRLFWQQFRPESDPFVKMLDSVHYGNCFVAAVPHLDVEKHLPRLEFLVPVGQMGDDPWPIATQHRDRLIRALQQTGFNVSAEHQMFANRAKIDVLPTIIIRAHDTVKIWAAELLSRVEEFVAYYLARYVKGKKIRGIRVRPFTKAELELLVAHLRQERELRAGAEQATTVGEELDLARSSELEAGDIRRSE